MDHPETEGKFNNFHISPMQMENIPKSAQVSRLAKKSEDILLFV